MEIPKEGTVNMTTTIVKPGEISPRKMDTSFIGRPHEWDPRRLYSQTAAIGSSGLTSSGCGGTVCSGSATR